MTLLKKLLFPREVDPDFRPKHLSSLKDFHVNVCGPPPCELLLLAIFSHNRGGGGGSATPWRSEEVA